MRVIVLDPRRPDPPSGQQEATSNEYRDLIRLMTDEMQRFSDEATRLMFGEPSQALWQPRVDIYETTDGLAVKAELAGVQADRIQVTLASDRRSLTITGSRHDSPPDRSSRVRCYQLEIFYGVFERTVLLPEFPVDPDHLTAVLRDGFLIITLPRRDETVPETRTIPIETA